MLAFTAHQMSSEEDYIVNAEMGVKEIEGMLISGVPGDRKHYKFLFFFFFFAYHPRNHLLSPNSDSFFLEVPCAFSSTISLCRGGRGGTCSLIHQIP